jgi:hypothetical protein
MARRMSRFVFNPIPIHAKLAFIDDEILIVTSANLSANRRIESYLVARMDEVDGVDELKKVMGNPGRVLAAAVAEAESGNRGPEELEAMIASLDHDLSADLERLLEKA